MPPFDNTKNKPSEWLAIDDVLRVSYDPSNNYTPLDVDWDWSNEPAAVDEPTPKPQVTPKPTPTSRDEGFDFGGF